MSLTSFTGRCQHCGHDHGENALFDVARGILTPSQQAQVNEQFANYAKQKPHLYGGCDEIISLREQVEKLTKERDALVNAIDNEMVVTHMGVFNLGDDPKVALNKICCYAQDLGKFFAEDACKEQLAALAEQNEKQRAFLEFAWKDIPMNEYAFKILEHVMNLPNLAAPALNRIRAEGMRMAGDFVESPIGRKLESLNDGPRQLAEGIRARAGDLEKNDAL